MPDRLPRMLISYHYYQATEIDQMAAAYRQPDLFADSGAYSARAIGADVSLVEYVAWLGRYERYLTCYANLDVIGDWEASHANQLRMEAEGLTPIPVWHAGEPWPVLEQLCARYGYVALGGLVGNTRQRMATLVKAFRIARVTGTALHGFGVARWSELTALPWYSTDATNWASGHRYGAILLFDPAGGRWVKIPLRNHAAVYRHAGLLRMYGADPKVLADRDLPEPDRYHDVCMAAAGSWMAAERWLRHRRGYTGEQRAYLADSRLDGFLMPGVRDAADHYRNYLAEAGLTRQDRRRELPQVADRWQNDREAAR